MILIKTIAFIRPEDEVNDACIGVLLRIGPFVLLVSVAWQWRLGLRYTLSHHAEVLARAGPMFVSVVNCFECWKGVED